MRKIFVLFGCASCGFFCGMAAAFAGTGRPGFAETQKRMEDLWAGAMETWDPKTGIVYGCDPDKSAVPADAKDNLYPMYEGRPGGWGPRGVGDAPLINGTALAGLVDAWRITRDPAVAETAAKVARGVINLAVLHGYKGFVCRGFCADRKTTCSMSSRDQYTHWVHGLWRYVTSGMADPALVAEYRTRIAEVADFMERRVTPERGWNFGLPGSDEKDYRGICTMWGPEVWPHEAARLPMIYAAAHLATGDAHWRDLYGKYIDEALARTLEVRGLDARKLTGRMPCYSLYQAAVSLELLLAYEKDPARQAKIRAAMGAFAKIARLRREAAQADRAKEKKLYGMCADGELLLTELIDPAFADNEAFAAYMRRAISFCEPRKCSVCRAAHIMAAYWRDRGNDGGLSDGRTVWGKPDPALKDVPLPDTFEVDFVRVYDGVQ